MVKQHGKEIFVFLYRLLQDSAEAEDCLQEAYLRAYRAYERLDEPANHRAWLYRIAHNVAMTRLNQRTRQLEILTEQIPSPAPAIESQIEDTEALASLRAAVDALPHKQRAALVMRKYQELSYEEIAVALDINREAARANVYQGLKKLRRQFSADGMSDTSVGESAEAGR